MGKGCLAAALLHPFYRCVGVEYLKSLHSQANKTIKLEYDKTIKTTMASQLDLFPHHMLRIPEIKFINDDFLQHNWSDASFVFSNCTCYSKNIMNGIFENANLLRKGSFFVTTTVPMPKNFRNNWYSIPVFQRLMSWGTAHVYIYRKLI